MARLTFDPRSEDTDNEPLDVFDGDGISLVAIDFPSPPLDTATTGSIDTEGDLIAQRRHANRQIPVTLEVLEPAVGGSALNRVLNPSAETDLSNWGTAASYRIATGATLLRSSATSEQGDASFNFITSGGTANQGIDQTTITVQSGHTYQASAYVRGNNGGEQVNIIVGDATVGNATSSTLVTTTDFQRISVQFTATASGTTGIAVKSPATAAVSVFVDGISFVEGAALTDYFDGDTPGCQLVTAGPLAGQTIRPASGGPLFRAIVADIEEKAAKLALYGGTLRWINDDDDEFTFDILASDTYDVPFDVGYFTGPVALPTLTLIALPYARGPESSTAQSVTETTLPVAILTDTVAGNVPALGRLEVTEIQGQNQALVLWGIQGRYYDSASTAKLYWHAADMTAGNATATGGGAGATGAGLNTMKDNSLLSAFRDQFTIAGTHIGQFRAFARIYVPSANTGQVSVRLTYTVRGGQLVTNPPATIATVDEDDWKLVDLGTVNLPVPPVGAPQVTFIPQALSSVTGAGDDVFWNWLLLVPTLEGHGLATTISSVLTTSVMTLPANETFIVADSYALAGTAGYSPDSYEGDYLRVPTGDIRLVVKASRQPMGDGGTDPATDDLTVTLHVTPRYLSVR